MDKISLDKVKNHPLVASFVEAANTYLGAIGYTEHGFRHVNLVSSVSQHVLGYLGYPEPLPELAGIAGYLHDIGNVINRNDHGHSGALIAMYILEDMGAEPMDVANVISAIGNHEEQTGDPVSPLSAALILADKSDVHRARVRNPNMISFDIHDRVNYAAERGFLRVDAAKRIISLELTIDTKISQVLEYFEIFLPRMIMCRRAAKFLNCEFNLEINETKLL